MDVKHGSDFDADRKAARLEDEVARLKRLLAAAQLEIENLSRELHLAESA